MKAESYALQPFFEKRGLPQKVIMFVLGHFDSTQELEKKLG